MKMKPWKAAAAALLGAAALLPAAPARAQDVRIGFVNADRVLRESAMSKSALAKLEAEFGKRGRELEDQAAQIKAAADKLDKEGPTLSESERTRRQRELLDQDRDSQRKQREFREDLTLRQNELRNAISERAKSVIQKIADSEKYDLILTDAVIFSSPRVDITDKVIKALDAGAAGTGK